MRSAVALGIILFSISAWAQVAAGSQNIALCTQDITGRTCTVSMPDVTRPLTEYPEVEFQRGDRVLVSATGCVNVGATFADWRRYVDPEGSGTDRFFHGLIWVPGARIYDRSEYLVTPTGTAPVRISSIAGGKADPSKSELLVIRDIPDGAKSTTLRLGYEIDMDDRGRWSGRVTRRGRVSSIMHST